MYQGKFSKTRGQNPAEEAALPNVEEMSEDLKALLDFEDPKPKPEAPKHDPKVDEPEILVAQPQMQSFVDRLTDMTSGTVEAMEIGQEYRAFPVEEECV